MNVFYGTLQLLPLPNRRLVPSAGLLTTDRLNYAVGTGPFEPLDPDVSPITVRLGEWHDHRRAVQDKRVRWSIDNYLLAETVDDLKPNGGMAGLWMRCGSPRIAVRSFNIVEP